MNKDDFWAIIEKAKDSDTETMFSRLENLSKDDAWGVRAYVQAYLELVNETVWVDMACKVINGHVSDDMGLYFTLWLISRGETVLLKALADPDSLSELPSIPFGNAEFERLMSIGFDEEEDEALEIFCETIMEDISPTLDFREGKQYGRYRTFEQAMDDIPRVLPKLILRAEREGFDWKN